MKILGGKDYYDSAGWGIDPTCIFLRTKENNPLQTKTPFTLPKSIRRDIYDPFVLVPGLAIVGEKIIPFYEKRKPAKGWDRVRSYDMCTGTRSARIETDFIYDVDVVCKYTHTLLPEKSKTRVRTEFINTIHNHMGKKNLTKAQLNWILENKITTLTIRRLDPSLTGENPLWMEANAPVLKDIEMYKVLDPATAHMTINSWISGVLSTSPDTVVLSDKDKIRKAGFDQKSFRKDPEHLL
jgi:hypothetical protein